MLIFRELIDGTAVFGSRLDDSPGRVFGPIMQSIGEATQFALWLTGKGLKPEDLSDSGLSYRLGLFREEHAAHEQQLAKLIGSRERVGEKPTYRDTVSHSSGMFPVPARTT